MYLRTLTNEELLRIVEPVTELEKELVKRLECSAALDSDDLQEAYDEITTLKKEVRYLRDSACKVGRFSV